MYISIIILYVATYISLGLKPNYVEEDMQSMFNRPDLRCPMKCNRYPAIHQMHCCICRSESVVDDLGNLTIEYKDGQCNSEIVNRGGKHDFYSLYHRYGHLTFLPGNICNFTGLFIIDLSFNNITNIEEISCLRNLDTLLLRGNSIHVLNKHTFLHMKFIRILDLSFNRIDMIDPGFLLKMNGSLFYLNLSFNKLVKLDITNGIASRQQYFCEANYSHNAIKTVTNEQSWKCKDSTSLGHGGMVVLSNNSFTSFFDVYMLKFFGFQNLLQIGKLIYYGFDFRDNKWNCDCKIYKFAKAAERFVQAITRDYFDVKCYTPKSFKDRSILTIVKERQYENLICNLSLADKCPLRCRCIYQPVVRNRTLIDCSNSDRKKIPHALPDYKSLEVDLSNNDLCDLQNQFKSKHTNTSYFERVRLFNFTNNKIEILPRSNLFLLRTAKIDFRGNTINSLHRSIAVLNPCNIYLGTIIMQCECDDIWLQQWLPKEESKCAKNLQVLCRKEKQLISIKNMSKEDLGCRIPNKNIIWISIFIVAAFVLVVLLSAVIYIFRFEIYIIGRKVIKKCNRSSFPLTLSYDVYISCNEDDENIRQWLLSNLLPNLEQKPLKVFWPCRDSVIGSSREQEIIEVMSRSHYFIIVLSEKYNGPLRWNEKEWKYAWHNYTRDLHREIIIVNYDLLAANEIAQKYLGAFLRIGQYIDFSNHKNSIENEIASMIAKNYNKMGNYARENRVFAEIEEEKLPFLKKYPLYSKLVSR
ncbi:unnamed protein product [Mytilus coruscus]|uniref:TIR domain-containing protein n=1 Tax=Mytilus coruscus TaxID=42192 RepID=A0A6J8AF57_MYTCO|nr:unnamed protein product [Mytilus coruscus]